MFNLSILTADMWAVVFRVFFYHQQVITTKIQLIYIYIYILFSFNKFMYLTNHELL
jgi:solute carrier family 35 protein F1/2